MILEVNHTFKKALCTQRAFFYGLCLVLFGACSSQETGDGKISFSGLAQGTSYHISYYGENNASNLQKGVDSILFRMDMALSNYRPNSQISMLNASKDTVVFLTDSCGFWDRVWEVSTEVYHKSDGAFDPSIYPLVKAYGFGPNQKPSMANEKQLDSLKSLVGLSAWNLRHESIQELKITKPVNGQLDFNAVAQGLAVDMIAEYLESFNVASYFVELGGEVRVGAAKPDGSLWVLGIELPENKTERKLSSSIEITKVSVATSGSNRKYYEENGKRYSHAIDAKTGLPVSHEILSVTLKHASCAYADAWATAALVRGKALEDVLKKEGIWFQFQ